MNLYLSYLQIEFTYLRVTLIQSLNSKQTLSENPNQLQNKKVHRVRPVLIYLLLLAVLRITGTEK